MQTTTIEITEAGSKVTKTSARVKAAKAAKKPKKEKLAPVRLIFILDRSTSMGKMQEEAIIGYNTFIRDQQALPGKATFSFVLFDTDVLLVYDNADLKKIPPLDFTTYQPRGMTALYDAIGYTVDRYKAAPKSEKTILAILTDGAENASRKYNQWKVQEMLKAVQTEGEWEVLFLGANIDTAKTAVDMGIKLNRTVDYDYTKKGIVDSIHTASFAASIARGATVTLGDGLMMNSASANYSTQALYDSVKAGANFMKVDMPTATSVASPTATSTTDGVILPKAKKAEKSTPDTI